MRGGTVGQLEGATICNPWIEKENHSPSIHTDRNPGKPPRSVPEEVLLPLL
ncbi:unnamed protein product [Ectocarpus sp. CCAP 1310/34]|nr:unnamed protein product [Ectocarpus sp. CCAP 1310/34]